MLDIIAQLDTLDVAVICGVIVALIGLIAIRT